YVFDVSVSEFFNSLLYGNELHLLDEETKKDADAISRYLLSHDIAYTYLPPVMLSVLPRVDYPLLKGLLYAGEPCDYETGKYWSEEKVLYNLYGPTEATIYATYKQVGHGDVHLIGRPVGNSSAYVLDGNLRLVPVGAIGELYLGGAGIARGYLNRPDLTEERFIVNPFQTEEQKGKGENGRLYSTGDLVRWLPDGNIEYIGRNDFQVKIRGYRIELGEIENCLSQYPEVRQSVVLAKENSVGMKYLAGYYVSEEDIDNEILTEYLSESLPEYMVPNVFVHLTSLPLTINGKLDRKQLPEPEFSGDREYTGPENKQQENLCKIYGDILGVAPEHIGIHDDFFRLGGNSIMAIKLISKIKQEMNVQVNVAMVFSHKTVASLSHILNEESSQAEEIVINPVLVSSPEEQRLSFAQERLWFIETYEGGSNAYNIPMIFMLGENVQTELLQESFKTLTQRHEVLRSLIRTTKDGAGYQVITSQEPPIYTRKVNSRKELDEAINYAANKVFRLEEELPMSINVFNLENRNYLSVVIHHIAFDGWSTDIFIRELCSIYQSLSEGKNPDLPELKIQYKDFALWQRDYLTGERLDQQIVYWKNKLDGFQTLDIPLDLKRPAHISYAGATQYFDLPADLVSELRNLSKDLGVSLYSMMLSGYYMMLSAYSGQDDIVVGSPVANRHHVGLEDIIGFFVNTLALREKINPDQTIEDFILQVAQSVTEAQSHQDLPFEKLVEELGVEQDMSRHPVFQVMFGLQSFDGGTSFKNHEAVLQPFDGNIDYQSAKFDLTMMIDDHGDNIQGIFNYAVSLFSRETIMRMIDSYLFFLRQLVNIVNRTENNTVKNLTLITKEDHQKITGEWNTAGVAYPEEKTIHQLFEDQVEKTPDHIALVYQDSKLSYRELNQKANQLAHYLIENYKLTSDDLVPLCLERSEDMLIAILAVLKAGAAYVPMDPAYPADRIKHILDDTGAKIVLTQERTLEKVRRLDQVTGISIDEETFKTFIGKIDAKNPVTTTGANNLAYVIYTSGTTRMPKGVMIEHRNVVNVVSQVRDAYGFSEGKKITAYTSYVFDVSVSEFFNTLLFGNELHLLDEATKKDADLISSYLLDHQIAYAYLPPVMLSVLPKIQYPNLKGLLYAGEPCDYETGKYWSGHTTLYNLYGPTEATIYATYKQVYHGDVHLIGRPVGNTSVYVLDNLYRPVPPGAVGELYIGGDGIARGYLNRPELTVERFISNPFQTELQKIRGKNNIIYKTGDLVRYLPNGDLEYLGRNDFQVKIRGYRIELGEIETALLGYPGIRQAVVLAKENTAGVKYLAGYYVSDTPIESSLLSEFLAESLPEYMVPNAYVYLDHLPLTINGKLDRKQLPEPEFTASMEYAAPENELQEKLCRIYGEVLGLNSDTIGIHDDFFKLGGNSIMAIKLISKIRNQLEFQIQVASVFSHKTIASLSSVLESDSKVNEQLIIIPIVFSSPEEQRLSFAQERLWFIEAFEGGSSAYNIPMAFSLGEKIKLDFLQKSIEAVVKRHEVLRSVIRTTEKGVGYQVVTDLIPEFTITEVETREELEESINRSANKIFRLEQELPVDINVFKLKEHYYLSVVVHHIAFDGWSIDVFLKEIQAAYEAFEAGKDSQLPGLKIQYKDFALWQRNYLAGEVLEKQIKYWKNTLDGFESLNLPLDHKRPSYISYEGASMYFNLSSETGSGLRKLSKDLGVSLNSVMLGGYYLMLSAYSGQDDIVLGSPIANRHHAGLEDMIGFFVNTLALRESIDPEQSLKDFILQVSKSVTEAQSHQDLPFEKLVEELGVEQDTSRHPVFQVMFGIQSFGGNSDNNETLFSPFDGEIDYQAAKFDLTTMIDDGEENIRGMFNYAVSLFNGDTIIKLKDTYVWLLEQLARMSDAEAKNTRINDLRLLEENDYKKITEDWNNTVSDYSSEKTIHRLFEDQVAKTPDHIALVYQDIKLSYKDLNEKANRLANYLIQTYNLQPDDIIPLCLDRSENMLIAMLGVLKSGAAYVPMDPSYPADRIKHILQDTEAKLVLGQESTVEKLGDVGVDFIALDEVNIKAQLELTDSSNPVTQVNSGNLAYVIYTSGTTGLPKGVMIEHKGVSNLTKQFAKDLDLISDGTAYKSCLWYANYVFDAHVAELYPVITHGHSIYVLDKERQTDIAGLQEYIAVNNISIATIPPVLLTKDYTLPLEKLMVAGDITNPQLMALYQAEGVDIINAYGPTEGTVCATLHYYKEDGNPLNIGGPIGNMTTYVLDGHMRAVPVGAVGELYIGGAGIARGYLNRPDLTEERFLDNPFQTLSQKARGENSRLYKTGDLVRWLANGELEYIGRNDFQVKIRGYRIELGEIENTLLHYPGIRQTAVLAKENKSGLKYLAGYYVSDVEIDSNLLSEHLSERLPEYMVPGAFVHLTALPLTINGKLDRKQLPEPEFTGSKDYVAPQTDLQVKLCQIYGDVLGLDAASISIEDDFFRLGGDSIISIQLVGRIRQQLNIRLTVREVFTTRTIFSLSLLIESKEDTEDIRILTEQGVLEGEVALLPIQDWFFSQKEQGYLGDFNHWNQAFLLYVPVLKKELLEESVKCLIERHDALRLQYRREDGKYIQQYGKPEIPSVNYLDASGLNSEERSHVFTEWQSQFDIENGSLYQIGYISGYQDDSARIYFAFHHLIIDAVSWRIITEDLKNIYQSLEKGDTEYIAAHTKGTSYRQWVEAVRSYKTENPESRAQELLFWNTTANNVEKNNKGLDQFIIKDQHYSELKLSKEMTQALIRGTNHAYHTQINDLLLSALSVTLSELSGKDIHPVLLESHGREEISGNLDITETVGWFTTMYPLLLKRGKNLRDTVVSTKEALRIIPNNGIGYGSLIGYTERELPKVSFNYLGQLDQELGDKNWTIAAEDSGLSIGKRNKDNNQISINGAVVDGHLKFGVAGYLQEEEINRFSERLKANIEAIVDQLSKEIKSILTPSDIDYIVEQEQLFGIQEKGEIEGVYLANSLQEGFVY
ncbi:amino acid adenylation domain-containing protein, partial [Chryseobacterium sp. WG14]|uniref:non-ribosomal peptide synthetase n=1 Tax=Chryseobacterium sp. WG14 TaxID=2926909 RepID=UPI00211E1579